MINTFKDVVTNHYADFNGRARRREYWMFQLAIIVFTIALCILAGILSAITPTLGVIAFVALGIGLLGIIIPALAVTVRRLHDTNKSGWMIFIRLIPFGGLVLFIFTLMEGDQGENQYGDDPKNPVSILEGFGEERED